VPAWRALPSSTHEIGCGPHAHRTPGFEHGRSWRKGIAFRIEIQRALEPWIAPLEKALFFREADGRSSAKRL